MSSPSLDSTDSKHLLLNRNLHIIFAITLMAVLGVSSITPAFPRITQALNISPQSIGLLITVFTLPGIFLTPVLGVFADRYGRKKILIPSMFLFGIAGGLCAFTRSFETLLIMRFFQGIGAASLGAINLTLIGDLFPGKQRTIAMGYNSSVLSVGTASYPAIGGAVAAIAWYYPFLLAFLAIPIGLWVLLGLNNPEPRNNQSLGQYLKYALKSMNKKNVYVYFTANLVTFIILYGIFLTYIPIFLHEHFQSSTVVIGLVMSSTSVVTAITASQLGRLVRRFSEIDLLRVSYLLYSLGLLLIPFIHSLYIFIIPVVIFGIGHGLNIPVVQSLLAGEAPLEHRAAFMSLNGMVLRLGQTLGPIIMAGIFLLLGLDWIFFAGCMLAVLFVIFLFIFTKKNKGLISLLSLLTFEK